MDEQSFEKYLVIIFLIVLAGLAFLIIKPIFISIVIGLLLAYIFNPIYKRLNRYIKNKKVSAFLLCILILLIIFVPIIFFTPIIIKQVMESYQFIQNLNLEEIIRNVFPNVSEQFLGDILTITTNLISKYAKQIFEQLTEFILDIPKILLQLFIVLIVFFFILIDQEVFVDYIKNLLPLKKSSADKFINQSKSVTNAVVFGQFITGLIQGIVAGIGFIIFGVSNVMLLTILAIIVGIIPIIGPWLVWFPVALGLLIAGKTISGIGLMIYGFIIISWIDGLIRPYIVAKTTKTSTPIILIGMIGGLFMFGFLGLLIGPLILGYLLTVLEFYQKHKFSELFH